jgi:hypothetical protein
MKKGFPVLLLFVIISFASCKRNIIKGSGSSATETRPAGTFTAIKVEAPVNAIITVDSNMPAGVQVAGYQNLVSLIKTEIKGGMLRIYTDELVHIDTDKDIEVKISTQMLQSLDISGAGEAVVTGALKADKFNLDITGAGDVTIDNINSNTFIADLSGAGSLNVKGGNVNNVVYDVTGAGEVTSFPLIAKQVQANVTGAGDVEINATEKLDVDITGAGNISYKGHPAITQNITGAGSIEDAN